MGLKPNLRALPLSPSSSRALLPTFSRSTSRVSLHDGAANDLIEHRDVAPRDRTRVPSSPTLTDRDTRRAKPYADTVRRSQLSAREREHLARTRYDSPPSRSARYNQLPREISTCHTQARRPRVPATGRPEASLHSESCEYRANRIGRARAPPSCS